MHFQTLEVRMQMGQAPSPLASLNSTRAAAGRVWGSLTTGTHRSHSHPGSIANAGDTCMHCTIHCLCAMQTTCGAGAGICGEHKAIAVLQKWVSRLPIFPAAQRPAGSFLLNKPRPPSTEHPSLAWSFLVHYVSALSIIPPANN